MVLHASIFGIGIGEMVVIAAIALVVIGPERFPEFARIVVKTIRDVRGYVDEAKQELDKELRPITREIRQLEQYQPKRYFDDITNKPKVAPKPAEPSDLSSESADFEMKLEPVPKPPATAGGAELEASPDEPGEPGTAPYQPPPTESDYDRTPTAFPKQGEASSEDFADEDEPYRD